MAFFASIAFGQTDGGIDSDSASVAECCCLISALTGLRLNQNLAMTSAVDQEDNILAIGGVTEKSKVSLIPVRHQCSPVNRLCQFLQPMPAN